ncbi:MAG: aldehyde dehydrogenase family protein [Candidatus Eremiobacteraeota bacterium]|nr:aldehyde dehydrogenase family protein [Candidatus Eremiobacteraeota bacterium]
MSKEGGQSRLAVRKTYKLYINGAFVRSESGRSDPLWDGKEFAANVARASRKDVRDAVVAARAAQPNWFSMTPALRGLIFYRLAEMVEGRKAEFVERLREGSELAEPDAAAEVLAAIDRIVWYAGWCDKYAALLSTRNPVGGPHFNFSTAEPMGVIALIAPDEPALLGMVSMMMPALVAGNTLVIVGSERDPRTPMTFAEALATSDLPAGVVNVLTGHRTELAPPLAKHMDVNGMTFVDIDNPYTTELQRSSAENLKRTHVVPARSRAQWFSADVQSLDEIAALSEIKTIWHPAGI